MGVLLDGSRWIVAAFLLAGIFSLLLGLGQVGLVSVREEGPTTLAFSALVGGKLTLVTIVISIGQLILSWELGSLHNLRRRKSGVHEFRHDVEESAGITVSPAEPTEFPRMLLVTIQERADAVGQLAGVSLARAGSIPTIVRGSRGPSVATTDTVPVETAVFRRRPQRGCTGQTTIDGTEQPLSAPLARTRSAVTAERRERRRIA